MRYATGAIIVIAILGPLAFLAWPSATTQRPSIVNCEPDSMLQSKWKNGACYSGGLWWPARLPGQCVFDDNVRIDAQSYPPPGLEGIRTANSTFVIRNMTRENCPATNDDQ